MTQFQILLLVNLALTCGCVMFALHTWMRKEYWKEIAFRNARNSWELAYQAKPHDNLDELFASEQEFDFSPPDDAAPVSFSEFKKIVDERKYGRMEDQAQ